MKRVGISYRYEDKLEPYAAALRAAGLEPAGIAGGAVPSLAGYDGLLISGGTDLDAGLYGEVPHPENEAPDIDRDRLEMDLLRQALSADLPVLAICRGMQVLNVMLGGTLEQHLEATALHRQHFAEDWIGTHRAVHGISVAAGSKLAEIVGEGAYLVNSRHHQAVKRVGVGLRITARADDEVVEAMEIPERRWVVAVQWHPEDRIASGDSNDLQLFRAFGEAL